MTAIYYKDAAFTQPVDADATKRYAVKAGGDWYNGFTFQRHDNKYLRHSDTNVGWTDKAEEATAGGFTMRDLD